MRITLQLASVVVVMAALATADHPQPQCGVEECVHRWLKPKPGGGRNEEDINGAAFITKMELHASDNSEKCGIRDGKRIPGDEKTYFDYDNTNFTNSHPQVYVRYECEATFEICFLRGTCEDYTLSWRKPNVTIPNSCIKSMTCFMPHIDAPCRKDFEYTFYNNFARTNGGTEQNPGCDCQFLICHVPLIASDHDSVAEKQHKEQQGPPSIFDMTGVTKDPNSADLREYNANHVHYPQDDNGAVNDNGDPHV